MKNFNELEEILYAHSNNKIIPGLERVQKILSRLGNPQDNFKTIHIVGTNGKGSTGAFISSVLSASGYRTAFYSSPHLKSPGERLLIDGHELSPDEWIDAANIVIEKSRDVFPSYFELLTACAFFLASENKIDAGVIEAGLGGKFDATNVMNNTVCSVVCSISIDHTEYLGNSLESIAGEKFAVVKPDTPACFSGVDESLIPMFKDFCAERGSIPFVLSENATLDNVKISPNGNIFDFHSSDLTLKGLVTGLIGDYQIHNASLALLSLSKVRKVFPNISEDTIRLGMKNALWPGRLEIVSRSPFIIFDGGHNFDGVKNLCRSMKSLFPGKKIGVVYAAMKDKNFVGCLELLSEKLSPSLYLTTVPGMIRASTPRELQESASKFTWRNIPEGFESPVDAITQSISENEITLVCGSLYLIGWVKSNA